MCQRRRTTSPLLGEDVERVVDEFGVGLEVLDELELGHTIVALDALGLPSLRTFGFRANA